MDKLDKIAEDIAQIKTDIAVIKVDVAHHVKRSDLNEESVRLMRQEIQPIKDHVTRVEGVLKFIGIVGILVGIAGGIVKLFGA